MLVGGLSKKQRAEELLKDLQAYKILQAAWSSDAAGCLHVAAQCEEATSFAEAYATDNAGEWQAEQLSAKLIEEARGLAEEHLQLWKTGGLPEQQQQQKKKQTERMAKLQVQWETMYNKMTEAQLEKC